jgi:hypothetical protein
MLPANIELGIMRIESQMYDCWAKVKSATPGSSPPSSSQGSSANESFFTKEPYAKLDKTAVV